MHRYLLAVLLAATGPIVGASPPDAAKSVAFTHVSVIDPASGAVRSNQTVRITANRISAVGEAGEVATPEGVQVVDGNGKFLIPGLWDMHVHWYDKDYLPLFLVNGVTGVRMMWGTPLHHEFRKRIAAGEWPGPRMVIASTIIDGPAYFWPGSTSVHTPEEARRAVEQEFTMPIRCSMDFCPASEASSADTPHGTWPTNGIASFLDSSAMAK